MVGFTVPIVLMALSGVLRYWVFERNAESTQWLVHTDRVIAEANELASMFAFVEGRANGIAGRQTEDDALMSLVREQVRLEALVIDNPRQTERLQHFAELFQRWRASARSGTPDPKIAAEIHRLLRELITAERGLLEQRIQANDAATAVVRFTGVALPIAAIGIALATAITISGRIGRRVRALSDTADALADGKLERRVVVDGADELGALATAFNKMADRLAERSRQAELLAELADRMQACVDIVEAHELARRFMSKAVGASSGALSMYNASRNLLSRAFSWGDAKGANEGPSAVTLQPEDCIALRRGKAHLVRDVAKDGSCKHLSTERGSTLCIPLMAHGETVGVLSLYDERVDAWSDDWAKLFHTIGEQLGLAFANLQLRARLRNQSIRDPLTGLFNRRYLEETFVRELARAARNEHEVGILVIDVDHFKRFNDTFGHDAGDAVLRSVGALLQASARESDVPCRFGGEEFVIVFADIDLETLKRRAERLREAARAMPISHRGELVGPVTISIGVAITPRHGVTPDALIAAADKALYEAKAAGRDRVVVGAESTPPASLHSIVPSARRRAD